MPENGVAVARVPAVKASESEEKTSWWKMVWAEMIARWEGRDEMKQDPLMKNW